MKKRMVQLILFAVIVVAAGITMSRENKKLAISDAVLINVEALTTGEDAGDCLIANCRWQNYEYCDYTCNGVDFSSSNMYNK